MATKEAPKKRAKRTATKAKRAVTTKKRAVTKKTSAPVKRSSPSAKKSVRRVTAKPEPRARTMKAPTRRAGVSGRDAIAVLKQDHRTVEQLFKRFEKAGDDAHRTKRRLVDSMIAELSRHAEIEELVFYPAVRANVDGVGPDVLEALEEHHVVKLLLRELEDLAPTAERFDAKVTVMMENVRHHVREEEHELFPEVRAGLSRSRLHELGDELRAAKPRVPSRPHPAAPDEPPGNVLATPAVVVLDRAREAGKRAVAKVKTQVGSG